MIEPDFRRTDVAGQCRLDKAVTDGLDLLGGGGVDQVGA
jgi:hypothetical protein